jgi:hypothetical protein
MLKPNFVAEQHASTSKFVPGAAEDLATVHLLAVARHHP